MNKNCSVILVADDDSSDQLLLKRALNAIGVSAQVQFVSDGAEAIAYLKGEGKYADRQAYAYPSCIITDLQMPRQDGFSVLAYLKNNPELLVVPVIVMSSSDDPDDVRRAYTLGANSYHVKPAGADQLKRQLKVMQEYWTTCEIPALGKRSSVQTGKLGESFDTAF